MSTDTGDQYVDRATLGDGWEYSIVEHIHGGRPTYSFILSASYSDEYCRRHNFMGGRLYSQTEPFESSVAAKNAMLSLWESKQQQVGYPYPDKMADAPTP